MGKGGKRKGKDGNRDRVGGGRGGGHDTRLSKLLSLVLRHKAVELGLAIAPDGYVILADLLALPRFAAVGATEAAVRRVAEHNDKQRFSLAQIDGRRYISAERQGGRGHRGHQGHQGNQGQEGHQAPSNGDLHQPPGNMPHGGSSGRGTGPIATAARCSR